MHRKAVKQFDKLTQWTGERFLKENKTELADEFREFENEIELRKRGAERLHATSQPFHANLSKRKPTADPYPQDSSSSKDKILAGEALGLVMISHGEDVLRAGVGDRSYGDALERFGRARCKIAMAQEDFTNRLSEGYLAGMDAALATVKEYELFRKKLDSRRLALDAANRKLSSSKKDSKALENEVDIATQRYEETQEDVYSRMVLVQEGEAQLLAELNDFLDAELEFVAKYQQILSDLKVDWINGSTPTSSTRPRSKSTSAVPKSVANRAVPPSARLATTRPLAQPSRSSTAARSAAPSSDEDVRADPAPHDTNGRSRSHSNASNGSTGRSRLDLASMVPSFGKKSGPRFGSVGSKQKYGSLEDDEAELRAEENGYSDGARMTEEEEDDRMDERMRTPTKTTHAQSYARQAARNNSAVSPRMVKALYPYQATADDELSMRVGDVIQVTRVVSSDWWIGEKEDGVGGLFPSTYTEPYENVHDSVPPPAVPAVVRPRTLPPPAGASSASSSPRSLAPPLPRSSSTLQTRLADLSSSAADDEGEEFPFQRPTTVAAASPSPLKKNKPPPPPTRRSTAASSSTSLSSRAHDSPNKSAGFEPPQGVQRMVMPGRTPPPMRRTGSSAGSTAKSPFGGSEDEEENVAAGVADCGVCGCDDFTQNVFKAAGTCSSCFHAH